MVARRIRIGDTSPTYAGPGDVFAGALGWWGLRAYSAAKAAALVNCVDIVDQAGANALTVTVLATGALDVASIATWVTAHSVSTIKIAKIYNQGSGGSTLDASQGTNANRPSLVLNVLNSKPVIRVLGSSSQSLATGGSATITQPNWVSAVVHRTGATGAFGSWFGSVASNLIGFHNAADTLINYAGTTLNAAAVDSGWHAVQMVQNDTASEIYVDGSNTTGTANTANQTEPVTLFTDTFSSFMTGDCTEIGWWNSAPDVSPATTNKSLMNGNQTTYWGPF